MGSLADCVLADAILIETNAMSLIPLDTNFLRLVLYIGFSCTWTKMRYLWAH